MRIVPNFSILLSIHLLIFFSCSEKNTSYHIILSETNEYTSCVRQLNAVVLENNFSPVVASRNYVYASIGAYEVIAQFNDKYQPLASQIDHLPISPIAKDKENIHYPLCAMLTFLRIGNAVTFPEGSLMPEYYKLKERANDLGIPGNVLKATENFSNDMVNHILSWSVSDNYLQTRSAPKYTVTSEAGRWIPTPTMYGEAIESHWNKIRSMTLQNPSQFMPPRPPKYNVKDKNSPYYQEVLKVYRTGKNLTTEQKHAADFWDDNPFALHVKGHVMYAVKKFSPPGHWTNLIGSLCLKEAKSFDETVAIYAHSAIAMFDANISAWDEKYRSNLIRPETIINAHIENLWRPYLQSPSFPAYTSGHSVLSNAVAIVLTKYFGTSYAFTDTTQQSVGIPPRSFSSLQEAGLEASISRLYGGIHYLSDLTEGNKQGVKVGEWVLQRIQTKKEKLTN